MRRKERGGNSRNEEAKQMPEFWIGFLRGLAIGVSAGAILGCIIAGMFASGKIADIIAQKLSQRENPKYAEKRINIKPRCSIK